MKKATNFNRLNGCLCFLSGLLLLAGPGLANDRTGLGEQTESSADAVRKAYAWSFDVLPENDDMPGIAMG